MELLPAEAGILSHTAAAPVELGPLEWVAMLPSVVAPGERRETRVSEAPVEHPAAAARFRPNQNSLGIYGQSCHKRNTSSRSSPLSVPAAPGLGGRYRSSPGPAGPVETTADHSDPAGSDGRSDPDGPVGNLPVRA